jgi:hypothetical protein
MKGKIKESAAKTTISWERSVDDIPRQLPVREQDILQITLTYDVSGVVLANVTEDQFVLMLNDLFEPKIRNIYKSAYSVK